MAGQWDTWLAAQRAAGKGGVVLPVAASRGRKLVLPIVIPGDRTADTLAGRVRASPDATGSPLATFAIGTPSYDAEADKTTFEASLAAGTGANSTGSLPADSDGDGREEFPVEFDLTPAGGDLELLFAAVLPVTGRI